MDSKTFTIRSHGSRNKDGEISGAQISIPIDLARTVGFNAMFRPELHEDGILFRFMGYQDEAEPAQQDVPAWVRQQE